MFWNTWDLWWDDEETRKIKEYRRKANYYETKYNSLSDHLTSINNLFSDARSNYGLQNTATYATDDVMHYQYGECDKAMKEKIAALLSSLEDARDTVESQKAAAYNLYLQYYNLAIRG